MALRTGVGFKVDFLYLAENNGFDVVFVGGALATEVRTEGWKAREIGKCFHTWNMGFPLPGRAARPPILWRSLQAGQVAKACPGVDPICRFLMTQMAFVETSEPDILLCLSPKESHFIRIVFDQLRTTHP